MNNVIRTLDELYLGNTMTQWWWALISFGATLIVSWLIKRAVQSYYRRLAATAEVELMELPLKVLSRTRNIFLLVMSLFTGLQLLTLTARIQHVADKVFVIAICWQVGLWASTAAMAWLDRKRELKSQHDRATTGSFNVISIIFRVAIWAIVLLLTLDNLGVNITTLVAGLGIGGIAVALAVQNVLGDLLASLSITLDKPFVIGDMLIVDNIQGSVEQIGLKSTRLRSIDGEQIIVANADLLKSRVKNFGNLNERRSLTTLQLSYTTPKAKLATLAAAIRSLVVAHRNVRFDRCHLSKLAATAIEFELVYYVTSAEHGEFIATQEAIHLEILDLLEREDIKFAAMMPQMVLAGTTH